MSATISSSEADILRRALAPQSPGLSAETLSRVDFAAVDQQQMQELAAIARAGALTDTQRALLHHYEVVNDLLGILRSKARITMQQTGLNPAK